MIQLSREAPFLNGGLATMMSENEIEDVSLTVATTGSNIGILLSVHEK